VKKTDRPEFPPQSRPVLEILPNFGMALCICPFCQRLMQRYDRRRLSGEHCLRKVLLSVVIELSLSAALTAAKHDFQTGKLVDIADDERLYEGTSLRWAVFTVRVEDIIYTARGQRMQRRSGDPGHGLIVGDPVKVAIDKDELILLNPDGKEMKMKITKRARAQ